MLIRRVVGRSMEPSLYDGRFVLARKKPPRVGDVVVALQNGREVVKRISSVQDDHYILLGDNGAHSTDSRTLGGVDRQNIRGVVVWPRLSNQKVK